jgi:fluoride exporter
MMAIWWVGLGGFLGANARYLLGGFISERWGAVFPYGTFVINVTGSFILGFFLAYARDRPWLEPGARLMFAVGFVGAYTTFSTFEYETMRLIQQREMLLAMLNMFGSLLTGMVAVFGGFALGGWI